MEAISRRNGGCLRNYTEPPSALSSEMSIPTDATLIAARRPIRADALRNYERLIDAAREAFADGGASTSLEAIARRAGVGIGTLYRHFPTRQALLEAVYLEELERLCRAAADYGRLVDPWQALASWLNDLVAYLRTKHALADQLLEYLDRDSGFFTGCRSALIAAGQPLLERAQQAGKVRSDISLEDLLIAVSAIGKLPGTDQAQAQRILDVTLDGLRYGVAGA
jgi:AcrR family transcriptional regulator